MIHYPCLELCSGDTTARWNTRRTRPPAARHAPAWRVANIRCMSFLYTANAANHEILTCATSPPGRTAYT
ncbi:hypothetical protein BRPE64_ACDS20740 [Caballeronia insecticola]|uniref:Uncharacterized protein n=1 Tax=Caballeronia insecticola TaxID=758793 RepID=R4WHU4_9BURK|nr:hypothetical protein BRPE64_ACDS20740 [Caballeronia insecticola]